MIENFYLNEWRQQVPWQQSLQVEQDLIISRALVNLYERPDIRDRLVFRGGTALYKIYFNPPARYSEDIDLVQIKSEPIGDTINHIRAALDSWLGEPKRKLTERSVKLIYSYLSQDNISAKLKIEINTTEHFHIFDLVDHEYSVKSRWFSGKSLLKTYQLNELMGTKLRALYQRRKGRDLFDLWAALKNNMIDSQAVLHVFNEHGKRTNQIITRAMFEQSLYQKSQHKDFPYDVNSLLTNQAIWSFEEAYHLVHEHLVQYLPGEPWANPGK
jgi:predicted nucleotidyltransferase component of viral defense system